MPKREDKERIFKGLAVSPGIGIGVAYVKDGGALNVPEFRVPARQVAKEKIRFNEAVGLAITQIGRLRSRAKAKSLPGGTDEELGYLLDAYSLMLKGSRLVRGAEKRIENQRVNAEAAIKAEAAAITESFEAMGDVAMVTPVDDIRDVANRLIRNLMKTPVTPLNSLRKGSVVIAEEMSPADTALLDPQRITGIATVLGGAEGHTAIMARALGLPAVLGATGLLQGIKTGAAIIVDGHSGRVVVNPTARTVAGYERRRAEYQRANRRLARLRDQPAITRDGTSVDLMANVELPVEMNMVAQSGAVGIGLLRSEFMFMNRDNAPDEEEQYVGLRQFIDRMDGRPVTVRTLDVGGEKLASSVVDTQGASVSSPLGLRGIRLSLARTDLFITQMRAILRAAVHGNVRILLPMVTTATEIRRARDVVVRAARSLKRQGIPIPDPLPPVGVMIEVPGAALSADALAHSCDFFAIGSNDLTMYTLAIDRGDEQVAHLYDSLHPAVLRLIQFSAMSALRARIPVSICGEMAGDPRYSALLLGMGFREFSMSAANIHRVKHRIRELDIVAADARAGLVMEQLDAGRIATLVDDFNALA